MDPDCRAVDKFWVLGVLERSIKRDFGEKRMTTGWGEISILRIFSKFSSGGGNVTMF